MLDGRSWVKKPAVIRSRGSTQKAVLAAPPQPNSPRLPLTFVHVGFKTTENPSPKPMPALDVSEKPSRAIASRSTPPGRWLEAIMRMVFGLTRRAPSSSPPASSSWQKRW